MNLNGHINTLNILNFDVNKSQTIDQFKSLQCPNEDKYILSDDDEELLLLFEFKKPIDLNQITLYALSTTQNSNNDMDLSSPKLIHIYKTDNINIDFNDVSTLKPDISIECKSKKLNKGQTIKLQKHSKNVIKFKKVKYLVIYIKSNQNDTELTYLNHITFIGNEIGKQIPKSHKKNEILEELNKKFMNENQIQSIDSVYLLQLEQNEEEDDDTDEKQCDLNKCKHLMDICTVLHKYHEYIVSQQIDIKLLNDEYNEIHLLNDFHHLLLDHEQQFEDICNLMVQNDNIICSLTDCIMMRRNNRDRSFLRKNDNELKSMYFDSKSVKDIVIQQLLDKIHCYFFHTFDIGYKLRAKDKEKLIEDEKDGMEYDINVDPRVYDKVSSRMFAFIRSKNAEYSNIKGLETVNMRNNKFRTDDENTVIYDDGKRFFYWVYYKDKDEENDVALLHGGNLKESDGAANDGYSVKDWYIEAKYGSLKEELISKGNLNCSISITQWNLLEQSAAAHLQSKRARNMMAVERSVKWKSHKRVIYTTKILYGIDEGQSLDIGHLISMMVYCNMNTYQYCFSESYRRLKKESDYSLKQRHSNYAVMGRLLRELIECYGTKATSVHNLIHSSFYRGINVECQFASIKACFKGPCSTTADYTVAVNFCNHTGLILELGLTHRWVYGDPARNPFMDVAWLSDYPYEQERFHIGGWNYFYIYTIIESNGINYVKYITAINRMIRNLETSAFVLKAELEGKSMTINAEQFAFRLLSHRLHVLFPNNTMYHKFKSIPKYIEELLQNVCINKKSLRFIINCKTQNVMNKIIKAYFIDEYGWIKLNVINAIFPSVTTISIASGGELPYQYFHQLCKNLIQTKYDTLRIVIDIGNKHAISSSLEVKTSERLNALKSIIGGYSSALKNAGWYIWCGHLDKRYWLVIQAINSPAYGMNNPAVTRIVW